MKRLPRLHIILATLLVAAVAGSAYLGFSYQQVEAKQPDLAQEIAAAQQRLEDARNVEKIDPAPYQQRLADLQTEIEQRKAALAEQPLFPAAPPRVEISDLIVASAQDLELTLLGIKPTEPAGTTTIDSDQDPKTKGNKYYKAEYEVEVRGEMARIISLIGRVEGAGFATLTVEDIQLTFVPEKEDAEGEVITPSYWEGKFTVVTLYQYTSGT
jgi:hypothetical protein